MAARLHSTCHASVSPVNRPGTGSALFAATAEDRETSICMHGRQPVAAVLDGVLVDFSSRCDCLEGIKIYLYLYS